MIILYFTSPWWWWCGSPWPYCEVWWWPKPTTSNNWVICQGRPGTGIFIGWWVSQGSNTWLILRLRIQSVLCIACRVLNLPVLHWIFCWIFLVLKSLDAEQTDSPREVSTRLRSYSPWSQFVKKNSLNNIL